MREVSKASYFGMVFSLAIHLAVLIVFVAFSRGASPGDGESTPLVLPKMQLINVEMIVPKEDKKSSTKSDVDIKQDKYPPKEIISPKKPSKVDVKDVDISDENRKDDVVPASIVPIAIRESKVSLVALDVLNFRAAVKSLHDGKALPFSQRLKMVVRPEGKVMDCSVSEGSNTIDLCPTVIRNTYGITDQSEGGDVTLIYENISWTGSHLNLKNGDRLLSVAVDGSFLFSKIDAEGSLVAVDTA